MRVILLCPLLVCSALMSTPVCRKPLTVRGGATDYSGAAAELFGNMRNPAALIAGSIAPVAFAAAPLIESGDSHAVKKLKHMHMILGLASMSAQIISIIHSTIAINKLAENTYLPAESVMALLKRDFELPWLSANINFLLGLFGFASMLGLRAWFFFGPRLGKIALAGMIGVLLHAISIVNKGIRTGGDGMMFATNFFGLFARYVLLVVNETAKTKSPLQFLSFAAIFVAFIGYVKLVIEDKVPGEPY